MIPQRIDRRSFLWQVGGGLGGIALAQMLGREGLLAGEKGKPEFNGGLHHKAKAKRVVQLFMSGAASQVDTFDYKPKLDELHGKTFDPGSKVELFQSFPGMVLKNPFGWKQLRQVRQARQQTAAAHRQLRRRHRFHPFDGRARPTFTARPRISRRPGSPCQATRRWVRGSVTVSAT